MTNIKASLAAASLLALACPTLSHASTSVYLDFEGGSGSQLSITIGTQLQWTIDENNVDGGCYFMIHDAGDILGNTTANLTATNNFNINGEDTYNFWRLRSGLVYNYATANDLYFYAQDGTFHLSEGDVVTLTSGTLTTTTNVASAAPADGYYDIDIFDNEVNLISTVPEPSLYASGAGIASLLLVTAARRRKKRA